MAGIEQQTLVRELAERLAAGWGDHGNWKDYREEAEKRIGLGPTDCEGRLMQSQKRLAEWIVDVIDSDEAAPTREALVELLQERFFLVAKDDLPTVRELTQAEVSAFTEHDKYFNNTHTVAPEYDPCDVVQFTGMDDTYWEARGKTFRLTDHDFERPGHEDRSSDILRELAIMMYVGAKIEQHEKESGLRAMSDALGELGFEDGGLITGLHAKLKELGYKVVKDPEAKQ